MWAGSDVVSTPLQRLYQGVVRDLERTERKKKNLRLLEEQRLLTQHLEEERRSSTRRTPEAGKH